MSTQKSERITRRKFLTTSAAGARRCTRRVAPASPAARQPPAPRQPTATSVPNVNTGAKQTVRYLSWWFEEGNRGKTWNALIKEFNASQKDIEVKAEQIPFDQYTTKTIVAAQVRQVRR